MNSSAIYDLLRRLFAWDPDEQITAKEALLHKWFQDEPRPTSKCVHHCLLSSIPHAPAHCRADDSCLRRVQRVPDDPAVADATAPPHHARRRIVDGLTQQHSSQSVLCLFPPCTTVRSLYFLKSPFS